MTKMSSTKTELLSKEFVAQKLDEQIFLIISKSSPKYCWINLSCYVLAATQSNYFAKFAMKVYPNVNFCVNGQYRKYVIVCKCLFAFLDKNIYCLPSMLDDSTFIHMGNALFILVPPLLQFYQRVTI